MSRRIACVIGVVLLLMSWPATPAGAEETDVKLIVLMEELSVFPDKADAYEKLFKELVQAAADHDFPYRFDSYRLDDLRYLAVWWIDGTAGIDNLTSAWLAMSANWGEEKAARWMADIHATLSHWKTTVWTPRPDLSYLPENDTDEFKYVVWGVMSIKPGHEKAMEELFKEYIEVFTKHEIPHAWNTAEGYVGVDNPALGYLEWSATSGAYWMRQDKAMADEKLAKDTAPLNAKILTHIRAFEQTTGWFLEELSYRPKGMSESGE